MAGAHLFGYLFTLHATFYFIFLVGGTLIRGGRVIRIPRVVNMLSLDLASWYGSGERILKQSYWENVNTL